MGSSHAFHWALVAVAFAAGWVINGWRWERDRAEFEAQANKKALQQTQSVREIERGLQTFANLTASDLKRAYDNINQKYLDALNRISDFERVQHNNPDSANPMPKTPTTTARTCKPCTGQSPRPDADRAKRALEIARDCDLLAVRYNKLVKFYESLEKEF